MDAPAPPAEQIRERKGRVPLPLARQENQRRQGRLRFLEAHVDLPAETSMPAQCRPPVLPARWCRVEQSSSSLERLSPPARPALYRPLLSIRSTRCSRSFQETAGFSLTYRRKSQLASSAHCSMGVSAVTVAVRGRSPIKPSSPK
jgi:hypothetical protein